MITSFFYSNAFAQGEFRVTYAKDQTYVQHYTKDKAKLFIIGVSCKYEDHPYIGQSLFSDVMALPEENYSSLNELKNKIKVMRDEKVLGAV